MANEPDTTEPTADPEEAAAPRPAPPKSSLVSLVVEAAFLTCFAAGVGGLFGMMVLGGGDHGRGKSGAAVHQAKKPRPAEADQLRPMPAIVTNLASPQKTWIRLEASILASDPGADNSSMAAAIAEDVVAYLRTVPVTQLEGPSGFLHLREDLNDRARIRSGGKVRELVIQSLVLE
ncbi:MAG TPA: flagellar basal body-associated FliL family protein [Hyphomicrobiaceae bacterium]|nr:flagellar basal body-associated FliL family protein [Hyphomicrobiaceae bacterium]